MMFQRAILSAITLVSICGCEQTVIFDHPDAGYDHQVDVVQDQSNDSGQCLPGYARHSDGTCKDIDECLVDQQGPCDSRVLCTNTEGAFNCGPCPSGYAGDGLAGEGHTGCVDVNECLVGNGGCDVLTTCTNAGGSRTCSECPSGYNGSGETGCTDVDECASNNGGCDSNTTCTNTLGGRTCGACPTGFIGDGIEGCLDVNECTLNNGGCDPRTTCTNINGGHTCGACPNGYSGDGVTGCQDINECLVGNGGCEPGQNCSNTAGSSSCSTCPTGFTSDGQGGCRDINECLTGNGGCDPRTSCTNTQGGRTCGVCPTGYSGDGVTGCQDINECSSNNGGCDLLTTCNNTPGSRTCGSCPSGYAGNGVTGCQDINECSSNNGGCDSLTTCTNTRGSRTCGSCPAGYSGNGVNGCTDINECATANGGCDSLTACSNTPGSRTCGNCPNGYTGNGETGCVDVNECLVDNGLCDDNATCSNTAGDWDCRCNDHYSGDGFDCTLSSCDAGLHICGGSCVSNNALDHCGASCVPCSLAANAVSMGCDGISCRVAECALGYQVSRDGLRCEDINECATNNGGCSTDANCTNTAPGRSCSCHDGQMGDGVTCAAIAYGAMDYVKAPNASAGAEFGHQIVISDDGLTMAVGVPGDDGSGLGVNPVNSGRRTNSGAVYIYTRNDGSWVFQSYIKATRPVSSFGTSLALSSDGQRLVAGSNGAVFTFDRQGGVWTFDSEVLSDMPSGGFGSSVDLSADGTRLVVGAPDYLQEVRFSGQQRVGRITLFERGPAGWTTLSHVAGAGQIAYRNDYYFWANSLGSGVALSSDGSTIFAGEVRVSEPIVQVPSRRIDVDLQVLRWGPTPVRVTTARLVSSQGAETNDEDSTGPYSRTHVSIAVAANGSTVAVGASGERFGTVHVYAQSTEGSGNVWVRQYVAMLPRTSSDRFGSSVSLSQGGDMLAIGAFLDDDSGERFSPTGVDDRSDSGAVHLFRRSRTQFGYNWMFDRTVKASSPGAEDRFGRAVALTPNADMCIASATFEDGSGLGLNPAVTEGASDSGALYVIRP